MQIEEREKQREKETKRWNEMETFDAEGCDG